MDDLSVPRTLSSEEFVRMVALLEESFTPLEPMYIPLDIHYYIRKRIKYLERYYRRGEKMKRIRNGKKK